MNQSTSEPAQKFLFTRTFDNAASLLPDTKAPPPPSYNQEQMDEACAAAQTTGYAAGEAAAQQSQQAALLNLTTLIEQTLATFCANATQELARQQEQVGEIAIAITRVLVPSMANEQAMADITALVAQICKDMNREPRLVVRVADQQLDPLRQQLDSITQHHAFAGKIILLADDALQAADCTIEWADGGIERNTNNLWQQIETIVQRAKPVALSSS